MRKFSQILLSAIDEAQKADRLPNGVSRNGLLTTLVAYAIGYRLPLPSGPVRRADEWFIINCLGKVEQLLGRINEHVVLDIDATMRVVRGAWVVRYRMLHDPLSVQAFQAINAALGSSEFELAPVVRDALSHLGTHNILSRIVRCESELTEELPLNSEA